MKVGKQHILQGDSAKLLRSVPKDSVSAIVTDPPYGWSFMGKNWDATLPPREVFEQCLRVLKPGARAFIFCGNRGDTHWRMLQMLEEVGFDVGYQELCWIYASGFPKGINLSKQLDGLVGAEREVVAVRRKLSSFTSDGKSHYGVGYRDYDEDIIEISKPATAAAKQWDGWYTGRQALKPAHEYIIQAVKPFRGTAAENVLRHGAGALNIDGTRLPTDNPTGWQGETGFRYTHNFSKYGGMKRKKKAPPQKRKYHKFQPGSGGWMVSARKDVDSSHTDETYVPHENGRFPATVLAQGCPDFMHFFDVDGWAEQQKLPKDWADLAQIGMLYCPKPVRGEKDAGCEDLPKKRPITDWGKDGYARPKSEDEMVAPCGNFHPTVKPVRICAFLIKLGCPEDGIVLDPFAGSGTTAVAAELLGIAGVHIELSPEYYAIMKARVRWAEKQRGEGQRKE